MRNRSERAKKELQDANSCLALGAGVGAMGTGAALLTGATCPLCVIIAPALIGVGVWKRFAAGREGCTDSEVVEGKAPESPS